MYRKVRHWSRSTSSFHVYGELLLILLFQLLPIASALQVSCPTSAPETEMTASAQSGTCLFVVLKRNTWTEATQACHDNNGHLVRILDSRMNNFLLDLLPTNNNYWIGLRLQSNETTFMWAHSSDQVTYQSWTAPRSAIDMPCGALSKDDRGWVRSDCNQYLQSVCEVDLAHLCPDGWTTSAPSGTCIKIVEDPTEMWATARNVCQSLGGDLLVILNETMNSFILDQIRRFDSGFWTGLSYSDSLHGFRWLDDQEKVNIHHWATNQSLIANHTDVCVQFLAKGWATQDCHREQGYICERLAGCDKAKYGMICHQNCSNCEREKDACNTRTGACYLGCQAGFMGATCENECNNRTFGANCSQNCSSNCAGPDKICSPTNGRCVYGCADGFVGDRCEAECVNNTFGANCSQNCSSNCAGPHKICSSSTGRCIHGCVEGFAGILCQTKRVKRFEAERTTVWTNLTVALLMLALGTLVCVFLMQRKASQERVERELSESLEISLSEVSTEFSSQLASQTQSQSQSQTQCGEEARADVPHHHTHLRFKGAIDLLMAVDRLGRHLRARAKQRKDEHNDSPISNVTDIVGNIVEAETEVEVVNGDLL